MRTGSCVHEDGVSKTEMRCVWDAVTSPHFARYGLVEPGGYSCFQEMPLCPRRKRRLDGSIRDTEALNSCYLFLRSASWPTTASSTLRFPPTSRRR